MTGPELTQLRHDLGDAIGKRLSLADMAKLCGLAPANGADTIRKWEAADGPSGPVAALLSILAYASDRHSVPVWGSPAGMPFHVGSEIATPIIRVAMRGELVRRLS